MKILTTWCTLLLFFGCLSTTVAQSAPAATEPTTQVKKTHPDHVAIYEVLASDHSVKHGKYTMKSSHWSGEGTYDMGRKTGVWSFSSSQHGLESQYDFTNLKLLHERIPATELPLKPKPLVYQEGTYVEKQVDSEAMLLGGKSRLMHFMSKNIRYPAAAQRAGIQGVVVLAIEIDENGQMLDHKVFSSVSDDLDKESLRVLKLVPNDWIPAVVDGKPARSVLYLPVPYRLM